MNSLHAILLQVKDRMTIGDVVEEYGYSRDHISKACKELDIKLPTKQQVTVNYIREMADKKSVGEIAKALDVHESYVVNLALHEGIKLMREKPKETLKKVKPGISWSEAKRIARFKENIKEIEQQYPVSRPRFKDTYTQSGSPYGIADESR